VQGSFSTQPLFQKSRANVTPVQKRQLLCRTEMARPDDSWLSLASAGECPGRASGSELEISNSVRFGALWCLLVPSGALGPANFRDLPSQLRKMGKER
jgi:hypothetical protein